MCYEDHTRQESGEDQDTVVCYEDQAKWEDCTDYNNVGINDEGITQDILSAHDLNVEDIVKRSKDLH